MKETIKREIEASIMTHLRMTISNVDMIEETAKVMIDAVKSGKKVLVCGNGGSASQAEHFSAEFAIRYEKDREAIPALSLTTNSSNVTACSNDLGYLRVFSRQVEAFGQPGDILVGITTSGNSENVIEAFKVGKERGLKTICLNGKGGGKLSPMNLVDYDIVIPSDTTARVQEGHIQIIHIWCKLMENAMNGVNVYEQPSSPSVEEVFQSSTYTPSTQSL